MINKSSGTKYDLSFALLLVMYVAGFVLLNDFTQQDTFLFIALGYSLAFGAYAMLLHPAYNRFAWAAVFIAVFVTMRSMPVLSDDVYRFLWDGHLTCKGINPYAYTPSDFLALNDDDYFANLYDKLNSPDYFSVYPLVCQLIFWLACFLEKWQINEVTSMKIIYCLFHFGGLYFAMRWCKENGLSYGRLLYYYLNPLVIVEGIGNLHAEVVMVALLIPSFYYLQKERYVHAAFFLACSIATKLIPLLLLPYLFFHLKRRKRSLFFGVLLSISVLFFVPVFAGKDAVGFVSSLDLYFRKFEFNAGIYYLLRWLGKEISGYNLIAYIGPLLGIIAFTSIVWFAYKKRKTEIKIETLPDIIIVMSTIHLLLTTTLHPWYLIPVVFWSAFTDTKYGIVWSYLITWTYLNYNGGIYHENMMVVGVEYSVVGLLIVLAMKRKGR